jgi:hypothetical protein
MIHIIQGTNIISRDKSGQIKCSNYSPTLFPDYFQDQFLPIDTYKETACSIIDDIKQTNNKDSNTLILNSKFFSLPGFLNAILNNASTELKIHSDIDFIINALQLKAGHYSLIDILKDETNIYKFEIANDKYSVYSKERAENETLRQSIADELKTSLSDYKFFDTLFSFCNVISTNEYLKSNEIRKEDFADLNFATSNVEINKFTNADLSTFFQSLAVVIQNTINGFESKGTTVIVKSPLTSYTPVHDLIMQNPKAIIINELELYLNSSMLNSIKYKPTDVNFELKIFPESKKVHLPFSIWILSEIDDLNFEITKVSGSKNNPIPIQLSDLGIKLAQSSFYAGGKTLVKYLMEIKADCCNNLHLSLQTIDKKEFNYLIKD